MNKKYIIGAVVALVVIIGILKLASLKDSGPGQLDTFAMCLKEKKAIFYGAFWCPHCSAQKKLFGNSAKLLPYKECSTPDGKNQIEECTASGIETYPTWIFEDGSKMTGEIPLKTLAEKTGCELPITK